ncbi:DUF2252 family protein [Pseudoalteromonas aurantia]|uniref:DUF2252 domain-containing protein n=1 Tax=Pseudoalteromonas aurantia TaxID=43654 RepID=A0ABY2VV60_9GAMM|nr:DUF2252 family protein [Pseudoalteromonas aurantia]TMO72580.1 hypothetical protein CWC20_15165 [Pseudoalteromonas aurantia]
MIRKNIIRSVLESTDGVSFEQGLAKHKKMASSPFLFFRGSAALMYHDLSNELIDIPKALYSLPLSNIVGDCHTGNFGFISEEGAHGDTLIFAPNDFDDACIGNVAWDLFRFTVSLYLSQVHCKNLQQVSDDLKFRQKPLATEQQTDFAAHAFLTQYLQACDLSVKGELNNQSALTEFDKEHILHKRWQKGLQRMAGGAAFLTSSTLAKELELSSSPIRFKVNPQRFELLNEEQKTDLIAQFSPYVDDTILDCVERLNAGTGSNNMRRYYLLVGPKVTDAQTLALNLCHIVEVKQQRAAAPLKEFSSLSSVNQLNPAHLTVNCQRKMQRRPDLVLDDALWQKSHWLIRSRHHARVGLDPEDFCLGKRAVHKNGFEQFAHSCGFTLALAHMRGDRRSTIFQQKVVEILPSHIDTLIVTAKHYAKQMEADQSLLAQVLNNHV